ncbi:hypothetical protein [Conexibacter woesei]|uniref:Uncharacterized protein n=1 Tax=Conexibacter woesei (strain DSM 14684 / CCUG 47730 / CIP 108061 / JCM 11494 / NBRC 100937 / ID131577) TaxID=469383 RepID=D3F1E9_CONWI|nr:hypothetical protein [Conexibacter woesei]ADB52112.1 hypothetical protein Cwoe_3695 [Conexibacter woesei DSM 14684]
MTRLGSVLSDAGGIHAARDRVAQIRAELLDAFAEGAHELTLPRSGYAPGAPVPVAIAPAGDRLLAVAPVAPALRADPDAVVERAWVLVAALVGTLVEGSEAMAPGGGEDLSLSVGSWEGQLALAFPLSLGDAPDHAEYAAELFADHMEHVDRLRAAAYAVPEAVLADVEDLRPPIGELHPLRIAEAVARFGGHPADAASVGEHDEAVINVLDPTSDVARPHDDRDRGRRVARRILQRLMGMGKWGGYHTEISHLARGFAGHDRALALAIGERLLDAGLLLEKPSVGQRHVFLNPRRAAEIHALVERGETPRGLELP